MKYLGIDYGAKHVGLALSDSSGQVAMPHAVVSNDDYLMSYILDLVRDERVETVVVGESKDLEMNDNAIQREIRHFINNLEQNIDMPIVSINELFSSRQAKWGTEHLIRFNPRNADRRKLHKKQKRIDDRAATIILQSYLDSQA